MAIKVTVEFYPETTPNYVGRLFIHKTSKMIVLGTCKEDSNSFVGVVLFLGKNDSLQIGNFPQFIKEDFVPFNGLVTLDSRDKI